MSAESVKAIWADRKTQTRRVVKPQPDEDGLSRPVGAPFWHDTSERVYRCPYGVPGDLLWVRRTRDGKFIWRKTEADLRMRVVNVRVERVQAIMPKDAIAEGVFQTALDASLDDDLLENPRERFRIIWDSLNAKRGHPWSNNDWVWAVTFERTEKPA